MQTQTPRPGAQPDRPPDDGQRRAQQAAASRQRRFVFIAAALVVVVIAALVAVRGLTRGSGSGAPDAPAPATLVGQLTDVPQATLEQVGRGAMTQMPIAVRGDLEHAANGLPQVTFIGAEYCPFCAGERWALINALSRFGSFSGLLLSHSATDDVYPNTATFSFLGSTYTSQYVDLNTLELTTNVRSGNGYKTLQTPTPAQSALLQKYDAPPYVPASAAGSIPFIDFAGQYLVIGATFDLSILQGMTQDQIAAALAQPSSPQAQAILGSANALTAAICAGTGGNPGTACNTPTIQSLEAALAAEAVPARS
jgi:hypothetical protein